MHASPRSTFRIRSLGFTTLSGLLIALGGAGCAHSKKTPTATEAAPKAAAPMRVPPAVGDSSAMTNALTPPKPKYGPPGHPFAMPLSQASAYFRSSRNRAPDFWALIGYYVPQMPNTCSAASVSMVVNAMLRDRKKTANEKTVTQGELLDLVTSPGWKKSGLNKARKMGEASAIREEEAKFAANADKDGDCASLEELEGIVNEVLESKELPSKVRRVNLSPELLKDRESKAYKVARMKVVRDLVLNESTADNFMIINFNQKAFTDDADAGHMAVVGALNPFTEKVLVLDPDREYYEPYWVTVDTLMTGMATTTSGGKTSRGYLFISRTGPGTGGAPAEEADSGT